MSDQAMVPYARAMAAQVRQRAILGINIGGSKASERDDGVEVLSVSPGGPAKAAGIKGGDVLLQIGGKSLKREEGTTGREKLLATLRDTKPGDKVVLNYRRDGKVATATVTTKPQDWAFTMGVPAPGAIPHIEGLRHFSFSRADGVFGSAELAPLTPKLGQYFGAEKGLLVVRAPNDARLQLEDGDVIVDIDGRVPSSPSACAAHPRLVSGRREAEAHRVADEEADDVRHHDSRRRLGEVGRAARLPLRLLHAGASRGSCSWRTSASTGARASCR